MIEVLVSRDGMTEDEAYEYIEFNVMGSYFAGCKMPMIVQVF